MGKLSYLKASLSKGLEKGIIFLLIRVIGFAGVEEFGGALQPQLEAGFGKKARLAEHLVAESMGELAFWGGISLHV
jgi:hypothetical protein